MNPISYYIEHTAITGITNRYGAHLEHLSNAQKFELIGYLGIWLAEVADAPDDVEIEWNYRKVEGQPDAAVEIILNFCNELMIDEALVFIAAITDVVTV